jgi:long-subunit acyl-CoA synthetase (AMP-forming)
MAARAVVTPINTRLTPAEVEYIIGHSGAQLILVDHEYTKLVPATFAAQHGPHSVIVSHDTGRVGCPYEAFLSSGRAFSQERSWMGLVAETDEVAPASLCYT